MASINPVVQIPAPMGNISYTSGQGQMAQGQAVDIDFIAGVDSLIVEQIKTFNNMERRCMVRTVDGQLVFNFVKSVEYLGCNAFQATLHNTDNQVVMQLNREITGCSLGCLCSGCCYGCCGCCVVQTEIQSSSGQPIGYLKQRGTIFKADVDIFDEQDNEIITIDVPCCVCNCGCCQNQNEFQFRSVTNQNEVGTFTRKYNSMPPPGILIHPQFYVLDFKQGTSLKQRKLMLGSLLSLYVIGLGQQEVVQQKR